MFWDNTAAITKLETKIDGLMVLVRLTRKDIFYMSAELDALKAEMARNAEVDAAAIAKISEVVVKLDEAAAKVDDLAAKLAEEQKDNADIQDLANTLRGQNDALAAAVASFSNAPVTPEPEANT